MKNNQERSAWARYFRGWNFLINGAISFVPAVMVTVVLLEMGIPSALSSALPMISFMYLVGMIREKISKNITEKRGVTKTSIEEEKHPKTEITRNTEIETTENRNSNKEWIWIIGIVALLIIIGLSVRPESINTHPDDPATLFLPEMRIPAHFTTYTDETNLFSISYPSNWEPAFRERTEFIEQLAKELIESAETGLPIEGINTIFSAGVPTEAGSFPNVNIVVESLPGVEWTLDEYAGASIRGIKRLTDDYYEFSRVRTTVDGKEAVIIEHEASFPNIGKIHALSMMIVVGKTGWGVNCITELGRFNEHEEDCHAIVRSLRVLRR